MSNKRILVIATQTWPLGARISIALAKVGFDVAAVTPVGGLIRKAKSIPVRYTYWSYCPQVSLQRAIKAWSPDFLVCADDEAVRQLHRLHQRASTRGDSATGIAGLIEASLGTPAGFPYARDRSKFILCAESAGVRCPKTIVVSDRRELERGLGTLKYPMVVKADGTYAGMGVRLAKNESEARTLVDVLAKQRQAICLQEYIVGRPVNRAVVCRDGKILAGISVEAVETQYGFGPASVVRVIDQPEMAAASDNLVKHLGLSGFVGFDFILDLANRAWLLEMNARVTPICHMPFADGTDLVAALYQRISGVRVTRVAPTDLEKTIVLFPQGIVPSRRSLNLSSTYFSSYHDVPWDEPALVRASIDHALRRKSFMTRLCYRLMGPGRNLEGLPESPLDLSGT